MSYKKLFLMCIFKPSFSIKLYCFSISNREKKVFTLFSRGKTLKNNYCETKNRNYLAKKAIRSIDY